MLDHSESLPGLYLSDSGVFHLDEIRLSPFIRVHYEIIFLSSLGDILAEDKAVLCSILVFGPI